MAANLARKKNKQIPHPSSIKSMASKAELPWLWVIETLAEIKQVDTSLLQALISKVHNLSIYASESIRERVALRYLEECLGSGTAADAPSTSGSGSGIEVARSSEEVLCSHLRKAATFCNHDLHQFIQHKRATLAKSSLVLLKESILEGHSQSASSLKDCSGISRPDQVDYLQCNSSGDYERSKKLKFASNDGETHSRTHGSVTLAPDSASLKLREPSGSEKYLPMQNVSDGDKINHLHRNIVSTGDDDIQLLEQGSLLRPFCNEKSLLKEGQIPLLKPTAVPALDSGNASLQDPPGHGQHSDCDKRDYLHGDIVSTGGNNVKLPKQSFPPQSPCKEATRPLCENDHFDGTPTVVEDTPSRGGSDDVSSNFEPNDEILTTEKHRLLSSQVHVNKDSIAGEWTEHGLCIKCDKGGQLLGCSTSGCLIAIHESCLGTVANFKEKGVFYCPFCSYSRAVIAYCKAREKVSHTKKALSAFIGRDLVQGHLTKIPPSISLRETSQSRVVGNGNQQHSLQSRQYHGDKLSDGSLKEKEQHQQKEANNVCNKGIPSGQYVVDECNATHNAVEINHDAMANNDQGTAQHCQLSGAANIMNNERLTSDDKVSYSRSENADVTLINGEGEVGNGCECIGVAKHQQPAEPHVATDNGNLLHEEELKSQEQVKASPNRDTDRRTKRHAKRRRPDADIGRSPRHQGNVEKPNGEKSSSSGSSKRVVQPKRYSDPVVSLGRRNKLFWTPEEEETLKDAVNKFAVDSDGSHPWTKILEFGRHTFHRSRKPSDLRDKWRNIQKKRVLEEET